ncbi:MAG TPA: hypothetical protein VKC54_04695 [Patescibacteria group bacterium]|nr:hypothetical protein [Patescibacteria group bacterium]
MSKECYSIEEIIGSGKIAKWTKEGHWPPPRGMTVLPDFEPDPEVVQMHTELLLNSLSPSQRKVVEKSLQRVKNEG